MKLLLLRGGIAAAIFTFAAQTAQADLTPQEVWSEWRDYLSSTGYEVNADESVSGDALTIANIGLTLKVPDEDATVSLTMPSITLTDNGDGTVDVAFPSPMPIGFSVMADGTEEASGEVTMTHSGSSMTISGDPAEMTYVHASETAEFALTGLTVEGEPVPAGAIKAVAALTGVSGTTTVSVGSLRSFDQQASAESMTYDVAFNDPDSDDGGMFKGALQGLSFNGTGAIPLEMDTADMNAMLQAGFAMDGAFSYTAGNSEVQGRGDGEQFSATSSSNGGALAVAMNAQQLAYDVKSQGTAISVSASQLPFPVSLEMATAAFNLAVPVAKSDEAQDFAFGLTLGDFTMSDMIWGLFDPAGALPRDPATVALDVDGKAQLAFDLMDPDSAAAMGGSGMPPGELHALNINNLLVSMVGARLSGAGAFTFDNNDLQTFNGMPRPIGSVDLQLTGANALIDKLIQMGFVSDQDAMGARMMMGMLAVPGDGPDSLKSKLEINEQGHIMANGQRIK